MSKLSSAFQRFAEATARYSGRPATFLAALLVIAGWAVSGPLFGFNDTWQLVINTGTTIITFLMVFLIQNSQNRESAAVQIKLDELIHATRARNSLLDLENVDEETLERLRENYRKLARRTDGRAPAGAGPAGGSADARDEKRLSPDAPDPDQDSAQPDACAEDRAIDRELQRAHARQKVVEQARQRNKDKRAKRSADRAG